MNLSISDGSDVAQVELVRKRSQSLVTKRMLLYPLLFLLFFLFVLYTDICIAASDDCFGLNDNCSDPMVLNKIVQQQYDDMNARLTELREQIGNLASRQFGTRTHRKLQRY